MAATVGSVNVKVMPSMSGFAASVDKSLARAGSATGSRFGSSFSKAAGGGASEMAAQYAAAGEKAGAKIETGLGSSFRRVAGVAATAFAAVGFGNLVSEAASISDTVSKFQQTLSFAGLDTSVIEALTKSTRAYADETVYGLDDIMNITSQLASNGVANYDKLAEAAGNLNAVAGGNAETYKTVGLVLTQTAGLGKLTTENWNQLSEAIPGASGMLKQSMLEAGAYTGSFNEAMANGEITAEEFSAAILDLGMSDAAAEAARSTSTFEGAWGNLVATFEGGLADMLTTLSPAITGLINDVNGALQPAFEVANQALSSFVDVLEATGDPMAAIGAAWGELPGQAQAAIGGVAALAGAFATFKAVSGVTSMVGAFKNLAGSISSIAGRAGGAAAGMGNLATGMTSVGRASASASQILSSAVAIVAMGAGIALAAAGIALLANAAVQVAAAGPGAIAVLVGMVAALALLAVGASVIGAALTAGAVGFVAFGAAVLMVGAGIAIACAGLALLATQLPVIATWGLSAAANIAVLGASSLALGAGLLVAGAGAVVFGAGALVAAAGLLAFMAAALVAAVSTLALSAGMAALAGTMPMVAASSIAMAAAMPVAASSCAAAAASVLALSAACLSSGAFVSGFKGEVESFAQAAQSKGAQAAQAMEDACRRIQGAVSGVNLQLPDVKVGRIPHFSMSGRFDYETGAVPTIDVSWYARGGIFDGASVVGVGERGPEAVVPLSSSRMQPFAEAVADGMGGAGNTYNTYVNGARVNDDAAMESAFMDFMLELNRFAKMQGAR